MMVLVTGASASGKSAWAEDRLAKTGDRKRIYLATMIPWDGECAKRIEKHRIMRADKGFETLECPVDISDAEIPPGSAVLLECLTNLVANELYREDAENLPDSPEERIFQAVLKLREKAEDLVIVTGEVFSDGQDYGVETVEYRKILGNLNRRIAAEADEVAEAVCGICRELKKPQEKENRRGPDFYRGARGANEPDIDKEEEIHMKLIVGGACQGKLDFAFRLAGEKSGEGRGGAEKSGEGRGDAEKSGEGRDGAEKSGGGERKGSVCRGRLAADGNLDGEELAFQSEILYNFHDYVRRFFLDAPEPERKLREFMDRLLRENPHVVIVSNELGCGIVPVEKRERLWRELCGNACQMLAGRAQEVYRVICGIPVPLKGGRL